MYFTPKPDLSNLAHFISPVIRPLLPTQNNMFPSFQINANAPSSPACLRRGRAPEPGRGPTCFYLMSREPSAASGLSWQAVACGRGGGGGWWQRNWGLLGQELQDERRSRKRKPDGGIDGWMSREESLSHPLSLRPPALLLCSAEASVSACTHVILYDRCSQLNLKSNPASINNSCSTLRQACLMP